MHQKLICVFIWLPWSLIKRNTLSYYKNKNIWITGASAGIGRGLAIALSKKGANLVLSSRKEAALRATEKLCDPSVSITILPLDLEDHNGLDDILTKNKPQLSQVDILINNGGISQRSKVVDTDFDVYKKLMDINFLGTVKLSLGILPYFRKRNAGQYVVISSMAGKFGVPVRSGYSASKMALHGFFDAMRAELKNTDIVTTIICPGYIQTDISLNALTGSGSAQGTRDDAQRNGMPLSAFITRALSAIENHKEEIQVGGFVETKIAPLINRLSPSLFKKIIARSKVT